VEGPLGADCVAMDCRPWAMMLIDCNNCCIKNCISGDGPRGFGGSGGGGGGPKPPKLVDAEGAGAEACPP